MLRPLLSRRIRPRRILAGPLRGRTLVTSWHDYPAALLGRTERPLLEWLARTVKKGETWLDVGAHYGYTSLALSPLVGPEGRVFSFEPMIATAGAIAQARAINGLRQMTVIPLGLACPDEMALVSLPTTRGMADGTLDPKDSLWHESIQVARFDWLWPQIDSGDPRIDGVKIDVQGMEVDVLKGMAHSLKRHRPVLAIEVHRGVDRQALRGVLREAGYSADPTPIDSESDRQVADRSYAFVPDASGGELQG